MLPAQFDRELYLAFTGLRRRRKLTGVRNHVAVAVEDLHLWRLKVRSVEQIKHFYPELQLRPFMPQRPVLEKSGIEIP
jgi:hypothetical protein